MNSLCTFQKRHITFNHISNKTLTSKIKAAFEKCPKGNSFFIGLASLSQINKTIIPNRWGCMETGMSIWSYFKTKTIKSHFWRENTASLKRSFYLEIYIAFKTFAIFIHFCGLIKYRDIVRLIRYIYYQFNIIDRRLLITYFFIKNLQDCTKG